MNGEPIRGTGLEAFVFEPMPTMQAVRDAIGACEGKHVQQVAYSSFMGALTQVCFTCQRVRSTIRWAGNRSWNVEQQRKEAA